METLPRDRDSAILWILLERPETHLRTGDYRFPDGLSCRLTQHLQGFNAVSEHGTADLPIPRTDPCAMVLASPSAEGV